MKSLNFLFVLLTISLFPQHVMAARDAYLMASDTNLAIFCETKGQTLPYSPPAIVLQEDVGTHLTKGAVMSVNYPYYDENKHKGPIANFVCGDISKHLATEGEALCAGMYADDYDPNGGDAKSLYFDTPVVLKLSEDAQGQLTATFNMPKARGGASLTILNCQRDD